MPKPAAIASDVPLFEQLRRIARQTAAAGDHVTHGVLHEIDLSVSDLWYRLERATKSLTGESLDLVRKLQGNL